MVRFFKAMDLLVGTNFCTWAFFDCVINYLIESTLRNFLGLQFQRNMARKIVKRWQ